MSKPPLGVCSSQALKEHMDYLIKSLAAYCLIFAATDDTMVWWNSWQTVLRVGLEVVLETVFKLHSAVSASCFTPSALLSARTEFNSPSLMCYASN